MTGYACSGSGSDSRKKEICGCISLDHHIYMHRYKKKVARTRQAVVREEKKSLKFTLLRKGRLKRKTRKNRTHSSESEILNMMMVLAFG